MKNTLSLLVYVVLVAKARLIWVYSLWYLDIILDQEGWIMCGSVCEKKI